MLFFKVIVLSCEQNLAVLHRMDQLSWVGRTAPVRVGRHHDLVAGLSETRNQTSIGAIVAE
jgi:hypothetical protein